MSPALPEAPGPSEIFVPVRRPPGAATTGRWRAAPCDEVIRPAIRDALWEFVRGTAPLLHPGATAPAERALLSGLNDGLEADEKTGMLGTDTAALCVVLRAHLGTPTQTPPRTTSSTTQPPGRVDTPAARLSGRADTPSARLPGRVGTPAGAPGRLGTPARPSARRWRDTLGPEGIRPEATTLTGITQTDPADVTPLLPEPPSPHIHPWLVITATVRTSAGTMAVDPGDGILRHVLDFTILRLDRLGPTTARPARCPACAQPRVRRYAAFDLCPDCTWHAQP